MPETIKLQGSDGEIVEVGIEVAKRSLKLKQILVQEGENQVIPFPDVKSSILQKVVYWLTRHEKDYWFVPEEININCKIHGWDARFLNVDLDILCDLFTAAERLEIPGLSWMAGKKIQCYLRWRTPEEIREQFGIKNDFTPAEEREVRAENDSVPSFRDLRIPFKRVKRRPT